jgi:hypothetical protein
MQRLCCSITAEWMLLHLTVIQAAWQNRRAHQQALSAAKNCMPTQQQSDGKLVAF